MMRRDWIVDNLYYCQTYPPDRSPRQTKVVVNNWYERYYFDLVEDKRYIYLQLIINMINILYLDEVFKE